MAGERKRAKHGSLSRESVLREGMRLAERGGLRELTMRKLAAEMGVGAMSLYHHVPNKRALVDGMIDLVFAEIPTPEIGGDWKAAMRTRAMDIRAVLARHRWAVGHMEGVLEPGPNRLRTQNAVLGCLREGGFSVPAAIQAMSVQDAYIYGFALQERDLAFADTKDAAQRARAQVDRIEERADAGEFAKMQEAFPYLAEVVAGHVSQVGHDLDSAFAFGIDLILDALEQRRDEV